MDYEEFRWALGDTATVTLMKDTFEKHQGVGDSTCRKLMRDFRLYMLVGGMPQAVNTYLDTKNLSAVDATKREIVELYADDFRKLDPTGRATRLFMATPSQLTRNASRYQVTSVLGRSQDEEEMEELIQDMEDSMVVNFSYHANDPSIGLSQHRNIRQYNMLEIRDFSSRWLSGTKPLQRISYTKSCSATSWLPTLAMFTKTLWLRCYVHVEKGSIITRGLLQAASTTMR